MGTLTCSWDLLSCTPLTISEPRMLWTPPRRGEMARDRHWWLRTTWQIGGTDSEVMNIANTTLKIVEGCLRIDTSPKADGYAWPAFADRCREYWWAVRGWSLSWQRCSRQAAWLMMHLSLLCLPPRAKWDGNLCHSKERKNPAWRVRQEGFIHLKYHVCLLGVETAVKKIMPDLDPWNSGA